MTFWPGAQVMSYLMLLTQAVAITWTMSIFFKPWYPLLFFLFGFIFWLAGISMMILHWPGGVFLSCTMILFQIVTVICLIVIVLRTQEP